MQLSTLDKAGFQEIAQALRMAIAGGRYAPNSQLPTIGAVAREYGTTAITVRRALTQLEREGLVRVVHGVGSFVVDCGAQLESVLPSFGAEMRARQHRPTTQVLQRESAVMNTEAAEALGLEPNAATACLTRLRQIDGCPVALQRSYLPTACAPVIDQYQADGSLYQAVTAHTGRCPFSASESLEAVLLAGETVAALGCSVGAAGWRSLRITRDAAGAPLVYDEAYFPADRLRLQLERHAGGARVDFEFRLPGDGSSDG